jgi:hypothetical protein
MIEWRCADVFHWTLSMSSHLVIPVGLGIHTQEFYEASDDAVSDPEPRASCHKTTNATSRLPRRTLTGPRALHRPHTTGSGRYSHSSGGLALSSATLGSFGIRTSQYRSDTSQHGDSGDPIVPSEVLRNILDEGSRAALDPMPPFRESDLPRLQQCVSAGDYSKITGSPDNGLPRDVTLLSFGGSNTQSAAELKSLLGNSNSRLKYGAAILPDHARYSCDKKVQKVHEVAFEQAKTRARVEVDIVLESNVCVQGGYLRGHVKVRVRKRSKKEGPILLSEGKIRVVGYESVTSEDEHHTFYHYAAPLSNVTDSYRNLYDSSPDDEGFSTAVDGVHVLPFALQLPIDSSFGCPKGVVAVGSTISVRYIAMMYVTYASILVQLISRSQFYQGQGR